MEPRVWVLLGKGAGGNAQMRRLAEALGWPFEEKRIAYSALDWVPNLLRGASLVGVRRRACDPLEPPWPDLVIAASRRNAPLARWIRGRSGGRAKLVHLFHAQAPLQHFDLILTLPQYTLPTRDNVLELTGALNRIHPEQLERAGKRWAARFESLPRPWIALIVGGDSSSYRFDPATAARLGREANAAAKAAGGSLLISTTPRTPDDSAEALFAAVDVPSFRYRWRPDDDENPYHGMLALADRIVVTVDSASLPMEACATDKPVQVFEWPRRGGAPRPRSRLRERLVHWGLVKPPRDFDAYHRALRERGLTTRLGEPVHAPAAPPDDLAIAVARIRALMGAD